MAKYKRLMSVGELRVGMTVTKDILADGKILISKGIPLTEWGIKKLRENYFYNQIEVYCEEEGEVYNSENEKVKTVEEIEQSFKDMSFDVENIYENMENLQLSAIEEIRSFSKKIQNELKSISSVIKNIVLYGSGSDTIYRHGVNVAALSSILGKWLGFSESQLNLLTYSAILHDLGKTKIDKDILDKAGPLTQKEFKEVKNHPAIGYNYVKEIPFLDKSVSFGVLMHHEKIDGSGYPLGLKGDKIHPFARIIAVADVFDAVNSDRAYKKSKAPFEALEIVSREGIGKLDYEYCRTFVSNVINYYMGEKVLLNNGKVCKIIQVDVNNLTRPLLLDDTSFIDLKQRKDLNIEKLVL